MGRGFVAHNMEMKVTAKRDDILTALRKNRIAHETIVVEAREGYVTRARRALKGKLDELQSGKTVSLTFNLSPPVSYVEAYDTAIKMLELHTASNIELSATEVRCLVMDEWDWSRGFLEVNKGYSASANNIAESLGI